MTPRRAMPALLLLFVGSGCAALIYEIVWFQLLQLVIGSSADLARRPARHVHGRHVPRQPPAAALHPGARPSAARLRVLELGDRRHRPARSVRHAAASASVYTASGRVRRGRSVRGVVASICLLPPTILMGATLPAMSRWVETSPQGVSWLGFFYGGNIAGASSAACWPGSTCCACTTWRPPRTSRSR